MTEVVNVFVGEALMTDWSRVEVARGINEVPSRFTLSITRGFAAQAARAGFDLAPFMPIRIESNGDLLLEGWVDEVRDGEGPSTAEATISGFGVAMHLVQSSAHDVPEEGWKDTTLETIVRALAAPFGIEPVFEGGDPLTIVPNFRVNQGEKAHAAIARLCALHGLLAGDGPGQALVIADPGRRRALGAIRTGATLRRWQRVRTGAERYARYLGRAQSTATDDAEGVRVSAKVRDDAIPAQRVLVVPQAGDMDRARLARRTEMEARLRAAKALELEVEVAGWREDASSSGPFWTPNRLVETQIDGILGGMDEELLVWSVAFGQTRGVEGGSVTRLRLVPPLAALPEGFDGSGIAFDGAEA